MTNPNSNNTNGLLGVTTSALIQTSPVVTAAVTSNISAHLDQETGEFISLNRVQDGQIITVYDYSGKQIGQVIVSPVTNTSGYIELDLSEKQINLEKVTVVVTDANNTVLQQIELTAPNLEAPTPPVVTDSANNGTVIIGKTEKNAQIKITSVDGSVELGTGVADQDGNFRITVKPAQNNGETIKIVATDPGGKVGESIQQVPDKTPPRQPDATSNEDGTKVYGTAEPGSKILVIGEGNKELGSGVADSLGNFTINMDPPLTDNQPANVYAVDASNNRSNPDNIIGRKDTMAPDHLKANINDTGTVLFGDTEPNAFITVRNSENKIIGQGQADDYGNFTINLNPSLTDGEYGSVTAADASNNYITQSILGPNVPPDLISAEINQSGTVISGEAEANAKIEVRNEAGKVIGAGQADANGHYEINLTELVVNDQKATVIAIDAVGNKSPNKTVIGPDIKAPDFLDAGLNGEGTVVTGSTEPNAKITVTDKKNQELGTATADANGNFTIVLNRPVTDGELIDVTAADAAGNALSKELSGPHIAPDAPEGAINDDGSALVGTAEPNSTIEVFDVAGNPIGEAKADANGNFTVSLNPALTNGEEVTFTAQDAAGNTSVPATAIAPDTTAPTLEANLNDEGTLVTGETEPNTKVEVRDPVTGEVIASGVSDDQGQFEIELNPALTDGNSVDVVAIDGSGNESDPVELTGNADTLPPLELTANLNADGDVVTGKTEAGAKVVVKNAADEVIGEATADANGNYTANLSKPLTDGAIGQVTASDAAGNTTPPVQVQGNKDTIGPDLDAELNDEGTVVTGKTEPGATVEVKDGNSVVGTATADANGHFTITLETPVTDGKTVNVIAKDAAGNPSQPVELTGTKDTIAPDYLDATLNADGTVVTGKTEAGAKVIVKDAQGNEIGQTTAGANGLYTAVLTKAITDGNIAKVTASDAAGNTIGPVEVQGLKDTIAPEIIDASLNTAGTELTGTATESKSTVTVYDSNNKVVGTGLTDENGKFTIKLDKAYVQGEKLTFVATDPFGNTGSPKTIYADTKIQAHDDVIKADVDLAYKVVCKSSVTESKVFGSIGKFLGISILGSSCADISFSVKAGETMSVDIKATNFGFATLLDGIRVTLYKQNDNGSWSKVVSNADMGLFNKFFLFFPEQAKIQAKDLPQGNYKIIAEDLSLFSFLSKNIVSVTYNTYAASTELEAVKANTVTGNLLADDLVTASTKLVKLTTADGKSVDVPATGTATLVGKYGTMVISADGTYKYTPNKDVSVVGKVDTFTYTIKDQSGAISTAKVNVQIGADEVKLNWDPTDPSKPATSLVLHDDADFVKGTVSQSTVTKDVASGNVYAQYCATSSTNSNTFTVSTGDQAKISVNFKAADCAFYADPSRTTFTWQLQKYNAAKGVWENVSGAAGSKTFGLVYQVKNGTTVFDGTVTVTDPGQYRVNFKTSGGYYYWNAEAFDTNVTVQTTNSSVWNLDSYGTAEGNIFTGVGVETLAKDSLGINSKLSISTDGGVTFKDVSSAGLNVQGQYGSLSIKADGSYAYKQNKGSVGTDDFVYKVVTANGESQTAHLEINYEYTVKGTAANDTFAADQILHILQMGSGADTVKFTALNLVDQGDVWTDFSKSQGDKIDVSALLSNKGVNASNLGQFVSIEKQGTNSVVKIDLDGVGTQHTAKELVVLQNTDTTLEELLKNNQFIY